MAQTRSIERRRSRHWLATPALIVALAALAFAGAAQAQEAKPSEKLRFSVERDLAGFEAAQWSEFADLYPFADYKEQDGKELTREELEALVAKWKGERERVTQEIAQLKTDPLLRSKRRLHKKLANHPFLSRLELAENDSFAPVLIVVQRPPKAKPGFDAAVAQTHGPWLKKAAETFEQDWKEVLPARREGCALLPVIFLASYGDFVNYCKTASGGAFNGAAHYNVDLHAVVCYAELMGGTRDEAAERRSALNAMVHLLIQSYAPSNDQPATQWWLREGLARLYSNWGGDAKAPQIALPDDHGLNWIGGVITNEHRRDLFFMPVQELLAVKDANDVYERMETRLGAGDVSDTDWGYSVRGAFTVECGLLVADLMHADSGKQRPLIAGRLALIAAAAKGAPPSPPAPLDPALLQKQLAATLQGELKRLKPPVLIDDALKSALATWKPAGANGAAPKVDSGSDVGKRATGLTGGGDDGPFDPATLIAEPLPVEGRLGIALRLAAIGEIEAAAWSCDELEKSLDGADPKRDRVWRESRRLHELAKWRRDFLEAWRADGKKLRVDHDGSSSTGTVKAVEENELVLLDAKGRDLRVSLAALDCEQILRRAGEAKLEVGTPLVRAYASLVAGHKAWQKGLAGSTPEESELKSDGAHWPELLAKGDTAARLEKLAHAAAPATAAQATAALTELRALFAAKEAGAVAEPRRELLRKFAALCFRRQFDTVGIAAAGLKGRVLTKPDGSVRITYTFDNPQEAEDWMPTNAQLGETQVFDKLTTPRDQSWMKIEKGKLRALGQVAWLSRFQMRAPMTVTFRYDTINPVPDAPGFPYSTARISLCDDGRQSRINTQEMSGIRVIDWRTQFVQQSHDDMRYDYKAVYDVRVVHDGKQVTLTCPNYPTRTLPCGPLQSGSFGIWIYSDAWVEIEDLEIEGHVDEQSLAPLRASWVEQQVSALEKGDAKGAKSEKGTKPGN